MKFVENSLERFITLTLSFALYANVDGFKYEESRSTEQRPEIDRWILSELNILIKEVKGFLRRL